jgi:hypothetical protein
VSHLIITLALSTLTTLSWSQTYLTPNTLGSGNLPGTYADLVFTLSDGNWTGQVRLPATAADQASIRIVSNATYTAQVLQTHTDVPLPSMALNRGQSLHYQYVAARQRWEVVAPTVWGPNNGQPLVLNAGDQRVLRARMANGAWADRVQLPASAIDGALVLVDSSAQWSSRIDPTHALHASTLSLRTNERYAFVYNTRLGKWTLQQSPETTLAWTSAPQGQMPAPVTARTRLNVPAGTKNATLRLPTRAGDRDRVVVTSSADSRNTIANTNVPGVGTMTIGKGQSYEFMWDAPNNAWVLMQAPRTQVTAQSIRQMMMPRLLTPVTELLAWDGNWIRTVGLPTSGRAGDRVVVKSSASWNFNVVDTNPGSQINDVISNNQEVVYLHDGSRWTRETDTIRILLAYGQGVTARLGANAARARQIESLRLTNEALANSGARFRFQIAGLLQVPNLGATLNDAVVRGRDNTAIQNERNRLQADAVYYEGIESGCGLAWVNSTPLAFNMLATGSLDCGTTVMRHELGHNMGLGHGNGVVPTVMSGNATPYFATPNRFDAALLVPKGHLATVPDEVTPMDRNAPAVSRFR